MGNSGANRARRHSWALRIALCVLLGACTTVAVAWAAAAWHVGGDPVIGRSISEPWPPVVASVETGRYADALMERLSLSIGVGVMGPHPKKTIADAAKWVVAAAQEREPFPPPWGRKILPAEVTRESGLWFQDARGWPMRALWGEMVSEVGQRSLRCQGGLSLPLRGKGTNAWLDERFLPLRIIPLGFVADTLLFGLAWCCILWMPWVVRDRRRRRRGRCPSCGYSLAGLAEGSACPECGRSRS
jgi:hypothetical protein